MICPTYFKDRYISDFIRCCAYQQEYPYTFNINYLFNLVKNKLPVISNK